jgi:hypothetical protein
MKENKVRNFLRLAVLITCLLTLLPAIVLAQFESLTRSRAWVTLIPCGADAWMNQTGDASSGGFTYPGYYNANKNTGHPSVPNQQVWAVRNDSLKQMKWWGWAGASFETIQFARYENYNFKPYGTKYPEEWIVSISRQFNRQPSHVKMRWKMEYMAWSVPKYDDFVIQKITLISEEPTATLYNVCYADCRPMYMPGGSASYEFEYIWDAKRGVFVYYDDKKVTNVVTGATATFAISPGNITGDVGDPGNITRQGSVDYQLYKPCAYVFDIVGLPPNINGSTEPDVWIGSQPFWGSLPGTPTTESTASPDLPALPTVTMLDAAKLSNPMPSIWKYPNPKMGWREAKQKNDPNAGSYYERCPFQRIAAGPFTLAPGDSVSFILLHVAGELDRNISMRGGPNATKMLDMTYVSPDEGAANEHAAIKDVRKNYDAAMELVNNNFALPAGTKLPPATVGTPPKLKQVKSGVPMEAEASSLAGASAAVKLTWAAVHEGYSDPMTGQNDFDAYLIYRSDVAIEGPWTQVAKLTAAEAAAKTSGGKVSLTIPTNPIIPYRYSVTTIDKEGNESGRTAYTYDPVTASPAAENDFSKVRVLPNPFKQFSGFLDPGEFKRLSFSNIPGECTIHIYNLALDLVKTIEHKGGLGDQPWGSATVEADNYMLTNFFRNVAPGLYIYHIESHVEGHEGETAVGKFVVIK